MTTSKFNKSEIFKNAWNLVKTTGKSLSEALKSAWVKAKKVSESITFDLSWGKTSFGATYKQISYMDSFDNFSYNGRTSNSQLMKRLDRFVASEIIDLLKSGNQVTLNV